MANKDSKVKVSFVATDQELQAVLQRVESRLDGLESSAKRSANALSFQALQQGIDTLKRFGQALYEVAQQGASFALLENEFTKLTNAAGENSRVVLEGLEKASQSSIAQRDLFLAANKANLLGVADTQQELSQLLEIAVARGDKLGVSTTQAFDNIVTGLGRQSALILDNLGILINLEKSTKDYATTLGKTVSQLSEQEKKQALVNAVIADSQYLLKDGISVQSQNQNKVESLSASWKNFTDVLSAQTVPVLAEVSEALANTLKGATDYLQNSEVSFLSSLKDRVSEIAEIDPSKIYKADTSILDNVIGAPEKVEVVGNFLKQIGKESASAKEVVRLLELELARLNGTIATSASTTNQWGMDVLDAADNARSLENATDRLRQQNEIFEESLRLSKTGIYDLATASAYAASELTTLEARLQSISLANAAFESNVGSLTNKIISNAVQAQKTVGTEAAKALAQNALNELDNKADSLRTNLESTELSALDLALTFGQTENDLLSPFVAIEEQNKLAQQSIKQTGKATKDLAQEAEQAFSQLQSKVSSVLSGALNLDVGVDPSSILPRQDDINENARRLADIAVKGFDSPWYEYFKEKFPALFAQMFSGASTQEGIKLQAANVLKNFQDGLVPELIDKETAKERVRRALIGEQNMAELAKEIATELSAELGTSISETQSIANSVLGGNQTLQIPEISTDSLSTLPIQFEDSFKSSFSGFSETFAGLLLDTFSAKVVVEASTNSGKINGETWGTGFLSTVGESVPSGLIDILTAKILPNIETALNQSTQRSNAR